MKKGTISLLQCFVVACFLACGPMDPVVEETTVVETLPPPSMDGGNTTIVVNYEITNETSTTNITVVENIEETSDDCEDPDNLLVQVAHCGIGVCAATGFHACTVNGDVVAVCVAGTPTGQDNDCDGVDNDCDGVTDEGCYDCAPTNTTDMTCDGVDDDCDGEADEDYIGDNIICIGAAEQNFCQVHGRLLCLDGLFYQQLSGEDSNGGDSMADCLDPDGDGRGNGACHFYSFNDGLPSCETGYHIGRTDNLACVPDVDADGDGYGTGDDCDDSNPAIHPGMAEMCDGLDNNCDGMDEYSDPAMAPFLFYEDIDGDGYGHEMGHDAGCDITGLLPAGFRRSNTDCNDVDANINPDAAEICGNGIDDNCNGEVDENKIPVYPDGDHDGYGNVMVQGASACPQDINDAWVTIAGDCNDADATINPDAVEKCGNGVDDNCDGTVDEGCVQNTQQLLYFSSSDTNYGASASENESLVMRFSTFGVNGGDVAISKWTISMHSNCAMEGKRVALYAEGAAVPERILLGESTLTSISGANDYGVVEFLTTLSAPVVVPENSTETLFKLVADTTACGTGHFLSASIIRVMDGAGNDVSNPNTTINRTVCDGILLRYGIFVEVIYNSDTPSGAASPSPAQAVIKFHTYLYCGDTPCAEQDGWITQGRMVEFEIQTNCPLDGRIATLYKDSWSREVGRITLAAAGSNGVSSRYVFRIPNDTVVFSSQSSEFLTVDTTGCRTNNTLSIRTTGVYTAEGANISYPLWFPTMWKTFVY